ncbi:MAG: 1-acyl-sn-glycerol-3-phosphate acyltransferase, partial [Oscillospiraceae bacterium]|nr:1-acyl-sn-glycerol-3-phosphate acyltransferase [Oscillospiraceae bacterium]
MTVVKHHRRNRIFFWFLSRFAGPLLKLLKGYRCGKRTKLTPPTLVISNHNTDLDPAYVGMGFSGHLYFVMSEHAARNGFASKVIMFIFAPILINKTHSDSSAAKEILRRLKKGYNVCLFAEGNRSLNGVTGLITVATAKLARLSGANLVTYRLEGGYFSSPRWSKAPRKGKMTGRVAGEYSAEQLKAMTDEEICEHIVRDTCVDAYESQRENPVRFRGKDLAEYLEIALYICPGCGKIGTLRSRGDSFFCDCGVNGTYTETGFLE